MPTLQENPFSSYKFTADDLLEARKLSEVQRQYLQSLLSDACMEKLTIILDPYKPLIFTQHEAYVRGQIDILNMLLATDGPVNRPKNAVVVPADAALVKTPVSLEPVIKEK